MDNLIKYVILFFFYSAAGWCIESTYCSIGEKRFINRGFLTGPMCPIYGTAATVLTVLIYNPFKDKPLVVFLLGIILCDLVEYITSVLMEKLFSARWWDYTYELFNLHGRICLKHSLYWGIISLAFTEIVAPFIDKVYEQINPKSVRIILTVILVVFLVDLVTSFIKALDVRKVQKKLEKLLSGVSDSYSLLKNAIEDKQLLEVLKVKISEKAGEFKEEAEILFAELEDNFTPPTKYTAEKYSNKKSRSGNRLFYNNPGFVSATKKQMDKIKNTAEEIKKYFNDT